MGTPNPGGRGDYDLIFYLRISTNVINKLVLDIKVVFCVFCQLCAYFAAKNF